jgi:hypothetical protein
LIPNLLDAKNKSGRKSLGLPLDRAFGFTLSPKYTFRQPNYSRANKENTNLKAPRPHHINYEVPCRKKSHENTYTQKFTPIKPKTTVFSPAFKGPKITITKDHHPVTNIKYIHTPVKTECFNSHSYAGSGSTAKSTLEKVVGHKIEGDKFNESKKEADVMINAFSIPMSTGGGSGTAGYKAVLGFSSDHREPAIGF